MICASTQAIETGGDDFVGIIHTFQGGVEELTVGKFVGSSCKCALAPHLPSQ